jgi:hypothetical protein
MQSGWILTLPPVSGPPHLKFNEEFHRVETTQQQTEAIAQVKDEAKRKQDVALLANDLEFAQAWKDAMGAEIDLTATTKTEKKEKAKAKAERVP